jgi:hypothetical protein
MRYLSGFFILLLLASCDPIYTLSYSVKNKTTDTVYVKFKNYPDSLCTVKPGSAYILKTERGIGFAKEKYRNKEFQDWFKENAFMVRKFPDNTMKKVTESKWKYEGHRIVGTGVLYIKK